MQLKTKAERYKINKLLITIIRNKQINKKTKTNAKKDVIKK